MPRPPSGRTLRTRRPRPSEKTTSRDIPGLSPRGHASWADPRGGAGSARPRGTLALDRGICPFGHRLIVKAPVATQCLAIRPAVPCGRAELVPPRKSPSPSPLSLAFFSIPDFPRDPSGNGPNLPPGLKTSVKPVSPICVFLEASPSWNAQP